MTPRAPTPTPPATEPPADLPAQAARFAGTPERWPAPLAELFDLAADEIGASGLLPRPEDRRALAARVVTRLSMALGGSRLYWPKPDAIARAIRDARIWAEHDGTRNGPQGSRALARRYRLTEVQVRAIVRAQRALHPEPAEGAP